jgi:nucleoporin NDC1
VAQTTADPAVTVVSGTTSKDPYYKHFAYAELDQLANDPSESGSAKRVALFSDQRYNPSLWTSLLREALLTLGHDYQHLLRRGVSPSPSSFLKLCILYFLLMLSWLVALASTVPAKKLDAPPGVPKTPFVQMSALKPSRSSPLRSALDTIASDGSITAAVTSTAEAGASQIPELFRSVMPSHAAAVTETAEAAVETVKKGEREIKNLAALPTKWKAQFYEEVVRRTPKFAQDLLDRFDAWWNRERVYRVVEAVLPNRKMDGLAVDGEFSAHGYARHQY